MITQEQIKEAPLKHLRPIITGHITNIAANVGREYHEEINKAFDAGANWVLEQQRWIPVDEAWPDPLQRVIFVVDAPGIHEHGKVYGGTYTGEPDSPYLRARNSFSTPGMGYPASHWMPAPEPPQL